MENKTQIVILAGGKGTRMNCGDLPKVLYEVDGKPMILHLLQTATRVCEKPTIVIGYCGEKVIEATGNKYHYVWQREQLGTGHAVLQTKDDLKKAGFSKIIVMYGDHPFVAESTFRNLIDCLDKSDEKTALCMATYIVPNFEPPYDVFLNYGRIIRDGKGEIKGTVEYKDATDEERDIKEVNLGYYCFRADWLWDNLEKLHNNNKSNEYYLTEMMAIAFEQGKKINSIGIEHTIEGMGINTKEQLEEVEELHKKSA